MKEMMSQKDLYQATYFEEILNKKILIVGLGEPPFGGISVHIARKIQYLQSRDNKVFLFDVIKNGQNKSKFSYTISLMRIMFCFKPHVIYYHTLFLRRNLLELMVLIFFKLIFASKLILVEHSVRFLYKRSYLYRRLLNCLICFINQQVLIGEPMLDAYKDNGIKLKNFLVESSFIPPFLPNEKLLFSKYPSELNNFLQSKKIILVMNASKFDLWEGKDIYGFDLCLRLMKDLQKYPVGLVMCVGSIYNQAYFEDIHDKIDFKNTCLVVNLDVELWPLIKKADLFLRPSRFDNYSVSVAEALYFQKPIIASDVGDRPSGVILFKVGDYDDFRDKVESWLLGRF